MFNIGDSFESEGDSYLFGDRCRYEPRLNTIVLLKDVLDFVLHINRPVVLAQWVLYNLSKLMVHVSVNGLIGSHSKEHVSH